MIEPQRAESLAELDSVLPSCFLLSIREEIDAASIEDSNNALKNSPHTFEMITS